MNINHMAATCRWAATTLDMSAPMWLEAWDRPWTCLSGASPRPLLTTEGCSSCPRWEPHDHHRRRPVQEGRWIAVVVAP